MRVIQLEIENFRGAGHGLVKFTSHTHLVGGNNVGKSTVCEALDLLLGPERAYRRPIVDEHDFTTDHYLPADCATPEIRIAGILGNLDASETPIEPGPDGGKHRVIRAASRIPVTSSKARYMAGAQPEGKPEWYYRFGGASKHQRCLFMARILMQ